MVVPDESMTLRPSDGGWPYDEFRDWYDQLFPGVTRYTLCVELIDEGRVALHDLVADPHASTDVNDTVWIEPSCPNCGNFPGRWRKAAHVNADQVTPLCIRRVVNATLPPRALSALQAKRERMAA